MKLRPGQKIKIEENDSVEFIHQVNSILESLIFKYDVGEVVFVKIKNWFDHKWLNFSGKSIVHFPTLDPDWGREESLDIVSLGEVTIPPFNPKRVIYSKFFRLKNTGNEKVGKAIQIYQRSTENRQRLVVDYTQDGLLLWFSSNTKTNQKGSLMVYRSQNNSVDSWYVLFENINGWHATKARGINLDVIQNHSLMSG